MPSTLFLLGSALLCVVVIALVLNLWASWQARSYLKRMDREIEFEKRKREETR